MENQKNESLLSLINIKERKKSWLECLPSNLSNLFYYAKNDGSLERVSTYTLRLPDKDNLFLEQKNKGLEVEAINIEMGCNKGAFAPIFTFQFSNNESLSFNLQLNKKSSNTLVISSDSVNTAKSEGDQLTEITKSIAELFAQKWGELTDLDVGHAFAGITYDRLPVAANGQQQSVEKMRRVKSYRFPKEDANRILDYITSSDLPGPPIVNVILGAGLTVRVNHPFNFRPIIFTGPRGHEEENKTGTYYERARPCPPFCKDK